MTMTKADEVVLALEPTTIAEWDVADLLSGGPAAGLPFSTREETARLLEEVVLSLPRLSPIRNLTEQAAGNSAVSAPRPAAAGRFDLHQMELPVGIFAPAGLRLTRLRLSLDARTVGAPGVPVLAYDSAPATGRELTNPVTWDLSGDAIGERFTACVVWRVPRRVPLKVSASLLGELYGPADLREDGTPRARQAHFRSASQYYAIPS